MIRLEGVSKRYGAQLAVRDLTIEFHTEQLTMLVGPSGCGKTTTLKMINRLIEPSSGHILHDDQDVTHTDPVTLRLRMGYVIQNVGLFPHLTIADNVATVPRLLGWDKRRIARRVNELLELVGLDPRAFAHRYPHQLSGGQRQRVGVARALGADPPVLLMDEPFSALDPITRLRLQGELLRVQSLVRKTIVVVTHDIDEALRLRDRAVLMRTGGRLAQVATPRTCPRRRPRCSPRASSAPGSRSTSSSPSPRSSSPPRSPSHSASPRRDPGGRSGSPSCSPPTSARRCRASPCSPSSSP